MSNTPAVPTTITVPSSVDATLANGATAALALAKDFKIDSREMYEVAAGELRDIVTKKKKLEESRLVITRPMDAAKKAVMDLFAAPIEALTQADSIIRRTMVTFDTAERARIAEEDRRARAAAEAERKRIENEALERAATVEQQERASAEELASELEQMGDTVQAAEVRELGAAQAVERSEEVLREASADAQTVVSYLPQQRVPKATGISGRENWLYEVTDLDALINAAAAGNTSARECLMANDKVIGGKTRSLKKQFSVPGIRVWVENNIAVRRA